MSIRLDHRSAAGARRRPAGPSLRLGSGLVTFLCACALVAVAGTGTAMATTPSAGAVRPSQLLAVLDYEHRAYQVPRTSARLMASVTGRRPITGQVTTLPVIAQATDRRGLRWLKVMLPGRPNGSSGWIKRAGTRQATTDWNIQIRLRSRRVLVYDSGRLTRTFSGVVGKPSTPTPVGHFFVEEDVKMPVSEPGGPYALALSARSNVLQDFDGGPGQIGIHGRDGLGGTSGQAESHGCIRLTTPDIDWLASRVGPGTPVTIT